MQSENYVFFWKQPSFFSQWTPSELVIDGVVCSCAEQYMMSEKAKLFGDVTILNQIMETNDPKKQKVLGRKVSNYNDKIYFH